MGPELPFGDSSLMDEIGLEEMSSSQPEMLGREEFQYYSPLVPTRQSFYTSPTPTQKYVSLDKSPVSIVPDPNVQLSPEKDDSTSIRVTPSTTPPPPTTPRSTPKHVSPEKEKPPVPQDVPVERSIRPTVTGVSRRSDLPSRNYQFRTNFRTNPYATFSNLPNFNYTQPSYRFSAPFQYVYRRGVAPEYVQVIPPRGSPHIPPPAPAPVVPQPTPTLPEVQITPPSPMRTDQNEPPDPNPRIEFPPSPPRMEQDYSENYSAPSLILP